MAEQDRCRQGQGNNASMTNRYAVIGQPVRHSKSPAIHLAFAQQAGQDISYDLLEAPLGDFAAVVDGFVQAGGLGLNITTPFKVDAFAYATKVLPRAAAAGAINAMTFQDGQAIGDNFDGVGLTRDIVHNLGAPLRGRRVLILGAGGAARGIVLPFLQQRPAAVVIANRDKGKADALIHAMSKHGDVVGTDYDDLARSEPFDVVVNATSASMDNALPPVPVQSFTPGGLAYDLAYGKGLTPFLVVARRAGVIRVADGVGMLVEQAAEAFAWWRGVRPHTLPVIEHLRVPLF